ncbi:RecQ family ATP-dependent DNA helicase [Desulfobacter curvatus]|uniref:RecQ family ATP-dependent DNA helicase n=1 Tax=Desulfobacter curvatus TaxID=2290 RepID=UPI000366F82F|nr:RecQ family ATP-dependent DNA helicase [Desulfobacter curvatus]
MEITQDIDQNSGRESGRIPSPAPTNLPAALPFDLKTYLANLLIIDFEATPDGDVFHIGAVFNGRVFNEVNISNPVPALKRLSQFAQGATYVLGHNIIKHDLALVREHCPDAEILSLIPIDTLVLSPLAFPENPYHRLIKGYKLLSTSKNNPVADAKLSMVLFEDELAAFLLLKKTEPGLIAFFAWAFDLPSGKFKGISRLFEKIGKEKPDESCARDLFLNLCQDRGCAKAAREIWKEICRTPNRKPELAYLVSWLRVAGGNSVLAGWVLHEFNGIADLVSRLRMACGDDACTFCAQHNNPERLLNKYFGFNAYRSIPDGRMLQREIVSASLSGRHHLAILPTGGGKSICYQIPALHLYERTGALTIVISPLKALMKDQVDNLNHATGTQAAAAINGSLTLPERGAVVEKVRLGDIGLLYISPEQLRNKSVVELIASRQVGCWIFDEAHCLSKWGHDFRPDYLHVADLIADQKKRSSRLPVIGAFTATAKKDVKEEIRQHFNEKLCLDLDGFEGGVDRDNLHFYVYPVTAAEKYDVIARTLNDNLSETKGSAIVYCASRKGTEALSQFLSERGIVCRAFHAGRTEPDKRNIQDEFVSGSIPVICATNAFGMGIDKKDIRLVIHADIPGSLENYLQEAGRAGRDQDLADCILLYEQDDIDSQFSLNAYSKLTLQDIKKILKVLKDRGKKHPEIVITPAEILRLAGYEHMGGDDQRARIAVAWLERRGFIRRDFNRTLFFKGVPLVKSLDEAEKKLKRLNLSRTVHSVYMTLLQTLFNEKKNALISADMLCEALSGIENLPDKYLDPRTIITELNNMANAGLIREGSVMTAFIRPKGKNSAGDLLDLFSRMEKNMADLMAELSPESSADKADLINLRLVAQRLKDKGFSTATTDICTTLLHIMAADQGESGGKSLKVAGKKGAEQQRVFVNVPWQILKERMDLRHRCARVCIDVIIKNLGPDLKSAQKEILGQFFLSDITQAMTQDIFLSGFKGNGNRLVEKSLLFLHDTKVITLQNGLGVFRQAFTLSVEEAALTRQYTRGDYEPLSQHYEQKNVQVHVMEKYAEFGMEKIRTALDFVRDYFQHSHDKFILRYFPGQKKIITTAMTAKAYADIIQSLGNKVQEAIVAVPENRNLLVLAGPGSGKTRTIVHRCAWLIKARSIPPESILVLCFNHGTMIELRTRIKALTGKRSARVTAMTFHGLAMRITGCCLMDSQNGQNRNREINFDKVIDEAVEILEGKREIPGIGTDQARQYLLARYRYILVDEYQDIDARQYQFITALTGRLEADDDAKIAIMAVGDDDQSIYGFRDANVKFIHRFKEDYNAREFYLTENYRCPHPVIEAANDLIAKNRQRMKTQVRCRINDKRKHLAMAPDKTPEKERVAMVCCKDIQSQAVYAAARIKKLLDQEGATVQDIAVISRQGIEYPALVAVRMALAKLKIPISYSLKSSPGFPLFKIREFQETLNFFNEHKHKSMAPEDLKEAVMALFENRSSWTEQVRGILDDFCSIISGTEISVAQAREFFLSALLEEQQARRTGTGVFTGTVHSIKGMEFKHVFILDHGWKNKEIEEERRLYYVGMTRAMEHLTLFSVQNSGNPHTAVLARHPFVCCKQAPDTKITGFSNDVTISILGMEDLYISFPQRFDKNHPIHDHLSALKTGDRIFLKKDGAYIRILNPDRQCVGSLSQKGVEKWKSRLPGILNAQVLGVVIRNADENNLPLRNENNIEQWYLPIVEILHRNCSPEQNP